MNKLIQIVAVLAATSGLWAASQGCGGNESMPIGDDSGTRRGSSNGSNGSNEELPQGLSACNPTCDQDDECGDCPGDQTVCDTKNHVCVACGPNAGGKTCQAGKECSQYGYCIPQGTACAVDATGVPTFECQNDAACAACSPDYRVCNTATKKCAKCNPAAAPASGTLCQATEACSPRGTCEAKCPENCASSAQCGQCGDKGGPKANVCTRGACSECNPTEAGGCGEGKKCGDNGSCDPKCGDNGNQPRECSGDQDCTHCKEVMQEDNGAGAEGVAGVSPVDWSCKRAIGAEKGLCVPRLSGGETGCQALAAQILPSPFNKITTLCEDDGACAQAGAEFDVGGLLGNLTDLPGIGSGTVLYPMKRCAKMEILGQDLPCGVCVPCKQDTDCNDINVIESVGAIFGPVGSLLSRVLSSAIFGDDPPIIHMTCAKVFGDFGACVPCSSILTACGDKVQPPDGGTGPTTGDGCGGRTKGWYCSGISRAGAVFCNGDGTGAPSPYFCGAPNDNCQAEGAGSSSLARTVTPSAPDTQSQDGKLPLCSSTEDPNYGSRAVIDAGASSSGGAQGFFP